MNHGPSPVQVIDIVLQVPTTFEGSNGGDFVTFTSLEVRIHLNMHCKYLFKMQSNSLHNLNEHNCYEQLVCSQTNFKLIQNIY